jgi:hypothetical protein
MPKLKAKKRQLPNAGTHFAHLIKVDEVDNRFYNPADPRSNPKRLEWLFEYEDEPVGQILLWSSSSLSSYKGTQSRALQITEAMLGRELTEEEKADFDTDKLLGKRLQMTVKHVKTDDGDTLAKVIDLSHPEEATKG